uniref:Putative ste20-like serine/threonine-protein kinase n=1 Tax=Panstrongylus megistus TaxID=65343 RepID=A0A069DTT4_9HEMI
MSSDLTKSGGPAAIQNNGSGTPPNIKSDINDQPSTVPEEQSLINQNTEKMDASLKSIEKLESQPVIQSDNEGQTAKETEETNIKPKLSDDKEINPAININNSSPTSEVCANSELNNPVPMKPEEESPKENVETKTTPSNDNTIEVKQDTVGIYLTSSGESTKLESKESAPSSDVKTVKNCAEETNTSQNENKDGSSLVSENFEKQELSTSTEVQTDNKTDEIKPVLQNDSNTKNNEDIESNSSTIKETKQIESKEEQNEESESIDVHELTEHIFNIINDGKSETLSTPQELLKKNIELQEFIVKLIQVFKEKTNLCANLERQNSALIAQAQSLKDVISITKDLLGIRNMEVEHLHADMSSMEERIKEERVRHNNAVARLNEAMTLNDKLKTEYLVQMDLFQKLREKYNEKVVILTKENQRLLEIVKNSGLENVLIPEGTAEDKNNPENVAQSEEINEENVDK